MNVKVKGSVDVIIPVYRPDEKLEKLIEKLNIQTVRPAHIFFMQTLTGTDEDDRVRAVLETADGCVITPVKKEDFDHGGTRNRAAARSEAEFMLFLTQDVIPRDGRLIEILRREMQREKVAVSYGRQLPGRDVGITERYTRHFNYPAQSSVKSEKDLERLGIKTFFCSNACAMYRRSVYQELGGFVLHTIFNEDMIMASSVIRAGYEIAYAAEAKVEHAHHYTYREQFSRNFDLAVSQRQYRSVFEGIRSESEGIRLVKQTAAYLFKRGKWYLLPDLILQSGFKYMGYFLGKRYDRLPKKFVRSLSMNKGYWDKL